MIAGRKVTVKDGNVDKALRKLKKKVADSGLLLELQKRQTYTKPSVERKVAKAMARKRWKKLEASLNSEKN
jgi:ribosomal protein S21